jgi:F0F1-type ATP synthase assembly protein I
VEENKQIMNNMKGPWWKEGIAIFTQVSVWIVVPILLALFVGKALDAHFGTKPVIFLILAGIGFLFSCFGIVRVINKYMKEIKDLAEKGSDKNQEK